MKCNESIYRSYGPFLVNNNTIFPYFRPEEYYSLRLRAELGGRWLEFSWADGDKITQRSVIRVVCPNVGHPALTASFTKYRFSVYAFCKCCRHATKIINHHSKSTTISKLTVPSQLMQNYFSPAKFQ